MVETDAAAFARQLRQDGIEAARAEAADIIKEARAQAAEIVQHAREAAGKTREEALSEIERDRQRFSAEIRLLARDTMLSVKRDIERLADFTGVRGELPSTAKNALDKSE
jgi:cell division septum initiation protein DivIVA